eukprot:scaffold29459_cov16-Tisochrysis_lutea.AAC.1
MKGTTLVIKKTAEIGAALSFLVMNVSRDEGHNFDDKGIGDVGLITLVLMVSRDVIGGRTLVGGIRKE